MNTPKKEPKRAISIVLEEKYIAKLDELKEALVRSSNSDVIRFLIADGAKKFLPQDCSIETINAVHSKRRAAANQ